ncbi:MAG: hypothetical protein M3337_00090 [Actinomycetota bacterium]|nr:hypothetical protein [Actinomycetota bacterium]
MSRRSKVLAAGLGAVAFGGTLTVLTVPGGSQSGALPPATSTSTTQFTTTTTMAPATTTMAPATTTTAPATTTTSTAPPATTTSTTQARSTTLIPIPAGCTTPAPATVVFVGQLVDRDETTARYELRQIRDGSPGDRVRSNLLDVRYDMDAKYLTVGNQYLVGAAVDPDDDVLVSKVRSEQPLFGGNEIVDVGETDIECPVLEDPVRTLTVTGRSIDSGVLTPIVSAQDRVLRAVLVPALVGIGAIAALAMLRWILTGAWRGATVAVDASRETSRQRRWR